MNLQKGQLITLEGNFRYREYEEDVHGLTVKHRVAEIHAISIKRLSQTEPNRIILGSLEECSRCPDQHA